MTPYRTKYIDPDYRRDPKTDVFCARCQKDIKGPVQYVVHLVDGGMEALHSEDETLFQEAAVEGSEAQRGDLGCHPIGPCCAKKIGLEWVHKEK